MHTQIEIYYIDKVRSLRIKNNMSQAEFAFLLGVRSSFIGKVESNKLFGKYNLNHINKIAKILISVINSCFRRLIYDIHY